MKYAYRLGKAVMLPVACLPVAGLLMGVGFWLDPVGQGENLLLAHVMILAGTVLIDNMSLPFTLGVAVRPAHEQDGTAALAGVISWLMVQKSLSPDNVVILTGNRVDACFQFSYINKPICRNLKWMELQVHIAVISIALKCSTRPLFQNLRRSMFMH